MASRLSEETLSGDLAGIMDAGHQGLVIESERRVPMLQPATVDLDALLLAEDPEAAVQAVPTQQIFQALLAKGPEDCIELLPLLSEEQVVRLLDYDAWRQDALEPRRAVRWLSLFKEVSDEEFYRRFRDLDEEYQLALLGPMIDLVDEDQYEKLGTQDQDALHRLPCGTLYYRIKTEDPVLVEFVTSLVEATMASDISYAYAMLAHAAFMPPHESEAQISQFRRARLTEDGFVSYQESLAAFRPIELKPLEQRWLLQQASGVPGVEDLVQKQTGDALFLEQVLKRTAQSDQDGNIDLWQRLLFLANSLCAAAQVEPDDLNGVRLLMNHAQALVSLGLEHLASGDVTLAAMILKQEHPQTLFRVGLTLVRKLADAMLEQCEKHGLPGVDDMRRQLRLDKCGALLLQIDQQLLPILGFAKAETLKGACNRLPVRPLQFRVDGRGASAVVFTPVNSMASLMTLASQLDAIAGLMAVAALGDDDLQAATTALDQRLMTALARVLTGGQFRSDPLSLGEFERLVSLPVESAQGLASDVLASIEGSLRLALAPGASAGWSVSRAAGLMVSDPVHGTLADIADLLLQLSTACTYAKDLPSMVAQRSAMASLINVVSSEEMQS
jgi:hypothetical protein